MWNVLVTTAFASLFVLAVSAQAGEEYVLGPDSQVQPGVPRGEITKYSWTSTIFPGTVRDYWVYVPKQYDPAKPAAVMVFQDGAAYIKEDGNARVPTVFDNLIHKGEMPITVGIFINPGVVPALSESVLPRFNRSFEYDGLGDRYARFLLEEILPEVGKTVKLAQDGNSRAIAGASSGAICAFNAAWERPDAFSRVFSTIGTYVGLRGGHAFSTLVRKTEPKPLRVFLQDGSNDLNIYAGDWWMANQAMLRSLEFAGYDVNHVWGDGPHDGKHGGSILPDALRWLWRDYPSPIRPAEASKQPLMTTILLPEDGWHDVGGIHAPAHGLAVGAKGEVAFTTTSGLSRLGANGRAETVRDKSPGLGAVAFGAEEKIYAVDGPRRRVVSYDAGGREALVADGIDAHGLAVTQGGRLYVTEPKQKKVWLVEGQGKKRVVDTGIAEPTGIALTPDQSLLLVADAQGIFVYSFQIQADGSLAQKQPYFHLHLVEGDTGTAASAMVVDANGYLYVTTALGIQVCDQAGRVNGIVSRPRAGTPGPLTFGGPELDELYVAVGDTLYHRKTRARGVRSFEAPLKPAAPRL